MDNITAKVSCFARAFHHKENAVHVFDGNVAVLLLGNDYDQIAGSMSDGIESRAVYVPCDLAEK